jgi:hypothetical protein
LASKSVPVAEEAAPVETEPTQEIVPDDEILRRIQAEMANRPAPRKVTIQELFEQGVALVASATGKNYRGGIPRVSEATAVKVYELSMMWALNNRDGNASHNILPEEIGSDAPYEPPTPDEVIDEEIAETEETN